MKIIRVPGDGRGGEHPITFPYEQEACTGFNFVLSCQRPGVLKFCTKIREIRAPQAKEGAIFKGPRSLSQLETSLIVRKQSFSQGAAITIEAVGKLIKTI
jgi:hypothetical protein